VLIDMGGVRYPMTKEENGVWTGVTNAQDEGFHYYQLNVDGVVSIPDPGTQIFYGSSRWGGAVEIPTHDQDFYALSYGSREPGSSAGQAAVEALKKEGVNSVFYESPLTAHEWQSWRRSLNEFAQLAFQT
jgi:hypothetical protein